MFGTATKKGLDEAVANINAGDIAAAERIIDGNLRLKPLESSSILAVLIKQFADQLAAYRNQLEDALHCLREEKNTNKVMKVLRGEDWPKRAIQSVRWAQDAKKRMDQTIARIREELAKNQGII